MRLASAEKLVKQLKAGNDAEAGRLLAELSAQREFNLFNELGRLTRELHEAINAFHGDTRIAELAETEIPDAKDRLNHVIAMTEQAANRTLDRVEEAIPLAQSIQTEAVDLGDKWTLFCERKLSLEEFKIFSEQLTKFLGETSQGSKIISEGMTEILMAQDYQDLTGQMIRRVIKLVQDVEENLIGLIRISGLATTTQEKLEGKSETPDLEGPQLNAKERDDVVADQDDVDDLLSSLGF